MSGLQKRMRRKLLTQAARLQRKETAGHGPKMRRPIRSWVQTTKVDLVLAALEQAASSVETSGNPNIVTGPTEMTPR